MLLRQYAYNFVPGKKTPVSYLPFTDIFLLSVQCKKNLVIMIKIPDYGLAYFYNSRFSETVFRYF